MRTRERGDFVSSPVYVGTSDFDSEYPYGDGPWVWPHNYSKIVSDETYSQHEITVDELHSGPPFKSGGPFDSWKVKTDEYVPKVPVQVIGWKYRYRGGHLPWGSLVSYLGCSNAEELQDLHYGSVSDYGAAGWNRFRPTNSGSDMGVFLGELREMPRMFRTTARAFHELWRAMGGKRGSFGPKSLADHWLNYQFGWLPFLNDLRKFSRTTRTLHSRLKQLRRDNGQWVKRGGTFCKECNKSVLLDKRDTVGLYPAGVTYLYKQPYGSYVISLEEKKNIWFEGRFRYWIPGKPGSFLWNARALAMLYGLQPSPSLVWELTPWSWLIDWCADVGDVISNMSSIYFDNLCAKYAYVMGTTERNVQYTGTSNYVTGPVMATWNATACRKSRVEASPFGFGLTGGTFSARQWSILSALGISRLR